MPVKIYRRVDLLAALAAEEASGPPPVTVACRLLVHTGRVQLVLSAKRVLTKQHQTKVGDEIGIEDISTQQRRRKAPEGIAPYFQKRAAELTAGMVTDPSFIAWMSQHIRKEWFLLTEADRKHYI
eukprot:2647859-Prymnesium_polylepis.1